MTKLTEIKTRWEYNISAADMATNFALSAASGRGNLTRVGDLVELEGRFQLDNLTVVGKALRGAWDFLILPTGYEIPTRVGSSHVVGTAYFLTGNNSYLAGTVLKNEARNLAIAFPNTDRIWDLGHILIHAMWHTEEAPPPAS